MPPAPFQSATQATDAMVRVTLSGELDLATVDSAQDALAQAEATSPPELVLDLSELTFMDSTGLRLVLRADDRSRENGDRLRLIPGPPSVQRVFALTGTEARLPFVTDHSPDSLGAHAAAESIV